MSLHTPCLRRVQWTRPTGPLWRYAQGRRYGSSTATNGDEDWFPKLRSEMLSRPVVTSREYINMDTDHKLADSLCTFMPPNWSRRLGRAKSTVPLGHNLVWFNTSMPVDQLLSDGTDPLQSPGGPWVRRMWAGGYMKPKHDVYYDFHKGFAINTDMVFAERIQDVQLRGSGDTAKIFVSIERRYARLDTLQEKITLRSWKEQPVGPNAILRDQILQGEEWGDAVLKEERNLVFLKEKTPAELEAIAAGQFVPVRYLDSPGEPDFSHSLTPTRSLLFRYSALTLNAHLIHLDRDYARNVEGHRNLLVHGPLSLTLMLQVIWGYIKREAASKYVIESIKYRNLAPLYCDEEMRVCIKKKETLGNGVSYDVWIEGPTGGVAVKGTVRTIERVHASGEIKASPSSELGHAKIRRLFNRSQTADLASDADTEKPKNMNCWRTVMTGGTTEQVDAENNGVPPVQASYPSTASASAPGQPSPKITRKYSKSSRAGVRKFAKLSTRRLAPLKLRASEGDH